MRRTLLAVSVLIIASSAVAADDFFRLSGWAAIPSEYRHPGPVSGQFAGPANGVIPPLFGAADPWLLRHDPGRDTRRVHRAS